MTGMVSEKKSDFKRGMILRSLSAWKQKGTVSEKK